MKIYLILFFTALTGADESTICKRCWVQDYTECCNEKEITCPGKKCTTISEYCTINNKTYNSIEKTCATAEFCGVCFSASTNHGFQMRISAECGEGDYSNGDLNFKKLCQDPLPPNGFKCPSCYLANTTSGCDGDGYVMCGGNQYECLNYRGTVQISSGEIAPISVQGCITEHGCDYGFRFIPGTREIDRKQFSCAKAEEA